ncbi:hypothetical protein AAVH_21504 [Aphelenchoides avenae]|nr:hypothetical protein AAVH_21504 [Aphelenchus avenae]
MSLRILAERIFASIQQGGSAFGLGKKCLDELSFEDVDQLIDMDEESAMGVKLDGRLLQELLGKQKELMESKHESAIKAREDER